MPQIESANGRRCLHYSSFQWGTWKGLGFGCNYTSSSLSLSHFLFPLRLIVLRSFSSSLNLAVRSVKSNPPTLVQQPPALGSVCAQRGAHNPGQDNRNRPPFVWASMGPMTVTVNSGHRLRPGCMSSTEGPLTRRAKAEKQNKQPSLTHTDEYLSSTCISH